jgi:nicotinate-nucleotide adenylyltransferase
MHIGLFFGTFNPIHVGHLIIANYMAENSDMEQVWLVVTPHNPLKKKSTLLDDYQRLEMVYRATEDYSKLRPTDIEFKLPQPSYTVNTLAMLSEKYSEHRFSLIIGEDNLKTFHKWKNYEYILKQHQLYVYPRLTVEKIDKDLVKHPNIHYTEAPIIEISSTFIRNQIEVGKNVRAMLPEKVWKYLDEMNFYK